MPNKDFNDMIHKNSTGKKTGVRGTKANVKENSVNWPGLPGKAGPDRSAGDKKVKTHNTSKGI